MKYSQKLLKTLLKSARDRPDCRQFAHDLALCTIVVRTARAVDRESCPRHHEPLNAPARRCLASVEHAFTMARHARPLANRRLYLRCFLETTLAYSSDGPTPLKIVV